MSKLPSAETQLRHAKAERKALFDKIASLETQLTSYRVRATKAEQEVSEWKRRFDLLLARTPEVTP